MLKSLRLLPFMIAMFLPAAFASEPVLRTMNCGGQECPGAKILSQKQIEGDALVKKFCTKCHTEGRIMDKLKVVHRVDGENFDQVVKSIIVKKIRLTGGEISHRDGKKILEYLVNL